MRIETNNFYFNQYAGLGATSKAFSNSLPEQTDEKESETQKTSPVFNFTRVESGSMNFRTELNTKYIGKGLSTDYLKVLENKEDTDAIDTAFFKKDKEDNERMEEMNTLLKKMGIDGKVAEYSRQMIPQNYASYYIETEGDAENLFILELENGELMFTETNQSREQLYDLFSEAQTALGLNEKLSIKMLKEAFAKFFDIPELKDFILEFSGMKRDYSLK